MQYAASVPFLAWRIIKKQHRTIILFRPTLFVMCRLGMLGLRAFMAANPNDFGIEVLGMFLRHEFLVSYGGRGELMVINSGGAGHGFGWVSLPV